jgi:hypothetical protein
MPGDGPLPGHIAEYRYQSALGVDWQRQSSSQLLQPSPTGAHQRVTNLSSSFLEVADPRFRTNRCLPHLRLEGQVGASPLIRGRLHKDFVRQIELLKERLDVF